MTQQEHPSQPPEYRPAEDEIDLADLVAVLYRNRWLILAGTLLVTLLAASYSWLQPERYEVKSFLAVGQINQEYIEEPEAVTAQLNSLAEVAAERRNENGAELGFSVENDFEVNTGGGGTIRVRISEAPQNGEAPTFIRDVVNQVVERHQEDIDRHKNSLNKRVNFLESQVKSLTERRNSLVERIQQIASKDSEGRANTLSVLNNLLETIRGELQETRVQLDETRSKLLGSRSTNLVVEPTFSDDPVNTNFRLHTALGLVLGAFLSVFAAFLREFWRNNRERITQDT